MSVGLKGLAEGAGGIRRGNGFSSTGLAIVTQWCRHSCCWQYSLLYTTWTAGNRLL